MQRSGTAALNAQQLRYSNAQQRRAVPQSSVPQGQSNLQSRGIKRKRPFADKILTPEVLFFVVVLSCCYNLV